MDEIRNLINRWQRAKGIMLNVKFRSICENNEDTSVHTITFTPSINLGSLDFEIGLLNLETYYSFPNIDASLVIVISNIGHTHAMLTLLFNLKPERIIEMT